MVNEDVKFKIHQFLVRKTDFLQVKDKMSEDAQRAFIDNVIQDMCQDQQIEVTPEARAGLIRELVSAVASLGPLRPLVEDKGITEIMGLCVIANILFCVAYPIDVVIQYSHFRSKWTWYRLGVFSFGLVFASLLTLQMLTVRFAGVI